MAKLPFVGHGKRSAEILARVHTDVCGPFDVQARGYNFLLHLPMITHDIDMCMRHKYETFERFKKLRYEVEK